MNNNNNKLAAQMGTLRELVSRNLSRLQAVGLIEVDGRCVRVLMCRNSRLSWTSRANLSTEDRSASPPLRA